jgi:hypothetical protein
MGIYGALLRGKNGRVVKAVTACTRITSGVTEGKRGNIYVMSYYSKNKLYV